MKNKYDGIMKNIQVTPDMRDRILANITDLNAHKQQGKVLPFSRHRKLLAVAACLVLLVFGAVALRDIIGLPNETKPPIQVVPDIVTYGSLDELSEAVGFSVKEVQSLPFHVQTIQYTAYWGEMAEIQYVGQDSSVELRMAVGNEDISGDSLQYASVKTRHMDDLSVTIKGNGNGYVLATWQRGGYAYCIKYAQEVSENEIMESVQSVV